MKKIIFFDLDNTIHDKTKGIIPKETLKLLNHLAKMEDTYLGLATGRGPYKIEMIKDIIHLFKYKIFINGALAYNEDNLVYKNPLDKRIVNNIVKKANELNVKSGLVLKDLELMENINLEIEDDIYQIWLFTKELDLINQINKNFNLVVHPWHKEGSDLVDINTNKVIAIKKLLENETNYKLICVGDGHNDIDMIELADVGIAMGNSGFSLLKEKADLIAPDISEDKLFQFFVNHQFFS